MNPVAVITPVGAVFDELESNLRSLRAVLSDLSLTETLILCTQLNLVISNPLIADHNLKQQYALDLLLSAEEIDRLNVFVKSQGGSRSVFVFFRGQLLELFRWVCLICKDDSPQVRSDFSDPETKRRFAQALLIAGSLWAERVYGSRFSLKGGIELARQRGLGAMREAIAETSSGINPLQALGRGWKLFRGYFPRRYAAFSDEFLSITGISIEQYYSALTLMAAQFIMTIPDRVKQRQLSGIFSIEACSASLRDEMRRPFAGYIALESQTPDEVRLALWADSDVAQLSGIEPYDFKSLRERPMLRLSDGRASIIDPVFFLEKAAVGALFLMAKGRPANRVFGAFGDAVEEYVNDAFERMYPQSSALATRFTKNLRAANRSGKDVGEITDGCLQGVTEAAFFEIKAGWFPDALVLDDNFENFLEQLRVKYGKSAAAQERPKGYAQLARAITNVARREWIPDVEFSNVTRIYPVLLVYDSLLDTPVTCGFLNSEFSTLLEPDEILRNGFMKKEHLLIAPLIVMSLEELEALEKAVTKFSLLNLFRDYTSSCADRVTSLHNFIAATEPYKSNMYANEALEQNAIDLLKKASGKLVSDASV